MNVQLEFIYLIVYKISSKELVNMCFISLIYTSHLKTRLALLVIVEF